MPRISPVEILLVEDNPNDAELMVEALDGGTLPSRVTVIEDGEEAMTYLRQEGRYAEAPRPNLVILDMHLPRMNGDEVLEELKQDRHLCQIPVVLLLADDPTPPDDEANAIGYLRKPDHTRAALAAQKIEQFWLRVARDGVKPRPS